MALLQWNIRGLRCHREDLDILIPQYKPLGIRLQETKLRDDDALKVNNYSIRPEVNVPESDYAHGGVYILIRDAVYYSYWQLKLTNIPSGGIK